MQKIKLKRFSDETAISLRKANYTIDYENLLNPAQYEAVSAEEGSYLIIAGAGTGKTRTLVYRLAHLIESGYDPKSVLLLTFTRKSAKEMVNRASLLLDDRCDGINGGTFHSFANITLRRYASTLGLANSFTILDQGDSEDVVNLLKNQNKVVSATKRFPLKATLIKIFSLSVNTGRTIEDIVIKQFPHFMEELDRIVQLQTAYTAYKYKNNLLDYDDMLVFLNRFLHEPTPAAKALLDSVKFLMVDEYQDTNFLQSEITRGLAQSNHNVMVVGDDAQSIYAFRGANFENIMQFPKLFPGTKIIKLEENYRSTPEILNFTNRVYEGAVQKYEKLLFSRKDSGELPAIIAAPNVEYQAKFIVERVLDLREEGIPLDEIAVLFRSSFYSFDVEIELQKANIPFIKVGGIRFIETAHVKDILAFLRIALNPKDVISWYRILLLHEGIGPKTAQKILHALENGQINLERDPEKSKEGLITEKLFPLFKLIFTLHKKQLRPIEMAELVIEYYTPIFMDKYYDDYKKRKKDIDTILNMIQKYEKLDTMLSDMAIEPPLDSVTELGEEDKQDEFLTLSTIHSAKGLEWHTIFIIHAVDGFFPSARAAESLETMEEERRLMYVAATRAKKNLYVIYPMNIFDRESGTTLSKPSRFLSNVTPDLAEGFLLEQ
ncbi:MAG: ATP-dependent helicase [Ignavibacteriales bacterium]|nr:ATP-dependent helicase [Ignavibacteriales bacterium]